MPLSLAFDTTAEKLRTTATLQLAIGLFLSDTNSAIAVLGILAVILSSKDLLGLFLVFCPLSILGDFSWLHRHSHGFFSIVILLVLLVTKVAATYFTYEIYSSNTADGLGEYQPFNTAAPAPDPFQRGPTASQGNGTGYQYSSEPVGYQPPPPGAMPDEPPSPGSMPPQQPPSSLL